MSTEDQPLLGKRPLHLPRMLWLRAAGRLAGRQAAIESFGAPGYGLTLAFPRTEGFAAQPRDYRPIDTAAGRAALGGRFVHAGSLLDAPAPSDPFSRPSPSRNFAVELHRFAWMPHLVATSDQGAHEALRLALAWKAVFGRWSPFAWSRETLPRRVYNLACAARRLAAVATTDQSQALADLLARQARHLLRLPDCRAWAAEHNTAAVIAGATLAGTAGDKLMGRALPRLKRALEKSVLPDGCHASRSPEAAMELLFDLLTLDDVLLQRGQAAPVEVSRAIDRLTQAMRLFTLGDGRLACFQGGEAVNSGRVAAARAHDDADGVIPGALPDGHFQRLQGQMLQVVADGGPPARDAYAVSACAQPLAVEIVCGKDRLITNAGWSEREPDRQAFRLTAAGSTLSLGETSVMEPLHGQMAKILGARLEGPEMRVEARRHETPDAVWVELGHDGWVPRYGLMHERRLFVDVRADELRAEDQLVPAPGARPRQLAVPYAVRFHLHPGVQVSQALDKHNVLLRGPSGRGWWFRSDAPEVAVEPSIIFENGVSRKTAQVVLRGVARTDGPTRVRWKIAPAGNPGDAPPTAPKG